MYRVMWLIFLCTTFVYAQREQQQDEVCLPEKKATTWWKKHKDSVTGMVAVSVVIFFLREGIDAVHRTHRVDSKVHILDQKVNGTLQLMQQLAGRLHRLEQHAVGVGTIPESA